MNWLAVARKAPFKYTNFDYKDHVHKRRLPEIRCMTVHRLSLRRWLYATLLTFGHANVAGFARIRRCQKTAGFLRIQLQEGEDVWLLKLPAARFVRLSLSWVASIELYAHYHPHNRPIRCSLFAVRTLPVGGLQRNPQPTFG